MVLVIVAKVTRETNAVQGNEEHDPSEGGEGGTLVVVVVVGPERENLRDTVEMTRGAFCLDLSFLKLNFLVPERQINVRGKIQHRGC